MTTPPDIPLFVPIEQHRAALDALAQALAELERAQEAIKQLRREIWQARAELDALERKQALRERTP